MGLHYPFEELSACGRVVDRMTAIFTTSIAVLAVNNGKGNRYQDDPLHGFIISQGDGLSEQARVLMSTP